MRQRRQNADVIGRLTVIEQQQQQQATPLVINNTTTNTYSIGGGAPVFTGNVSGDVQHVHYHGNVYQNGGDVAINTNATTYNIEGGSNTINTINGGDGPPNGPFVAGGAAGQGTAAGTGTGGGTDPPLLGGDEALVRHPALLAMKSRASSRVR